MVQIYLDCDGVLADFDRAAADVFHMPPREYERRFGLPAFWKRLANTPDFYARIPLMADAMTLFEAVRHLSPIILTGCPRGGWAERQKRRWAALHFPGTPIITCMARRKFEYCRPGDVLVDDTLKFRDLWENAGGIFIHHVNARLTLEALRTAVPQAFSQSVA
jgi:hypothetical protein